MSFDWAMKRLLRDKANFDVLEGFISTLLGKKVKIQKLLESESNLERPDAKYNRVDLLAEDEDGDLLLIEVQGEPEFAFFQRMLFGTSKLVTEYIDGGNNYENVKKVYAINIVYFNLGQGSDVVYHGKTEFHGIHNGELLQLTPFQQQQFAVDEVYQLYPEYFILKVNDFNHWSRVPLEQWLYFLATSDIPDDADAPGLPQAREKLRLMRMNRDEQIDYDRYLMDRAVLRNTMVTARGEGKIEGRAEGFDEGYGEGMEKGMAEGLEKGMAEGMEKGMAEGELRKQREIALEMKKGGISPEQIALFTGLTVEEIHQL